MNIRREVKISLMGIVLGTVILAIGEILFIPLPEKKSFPDRNFPEQVSLPGWQASSSTLPQSFKSELLRSIPGKSYQYIQNNSLVNRNIDYDAETQDTQSKKSVGKIFNSSLIVANKLTLGSHTEPRQSLQDLKAASKHSHSSEPLSIDIHMHYITDLHDVKKLLKKYTSLPHHALETFEQEDIGFYGVLIHQDQLHLSACITPRKGSVVHNVHFYHNYPTLQKISERLVFWLLGEKPLVEQVCLWSHLSIPLSNSSPQKAYLTLEKVWFSWYQHWHPYLVATISRN